MLKEKPFILITGDDSVRAEGTILIKRIVEDFADYKIIATKEQQSAVGGRISLKEGGKWGTEIVDGVKTIWVNGTPADAVYFAFSYLKRKPDLVISGMNHGPNISNGSMYISGTVSAAAISAMSRETPTIAFSFNSAPNRWFKDHNGEFDEELLEYPGEIIRKMIIYALEHKMEKYTFWNVNFPEKPTNQVKYVKALPKGFFPNNITVDRDKYYYIPELGDENPDADTDVSALFGGAISFTPCRLEYTDHEKLQELKKEKPF